MPLIRITEPSDPRLNDYRNLTDTALRKVSEPAGGLYIAESAKVIERAVHAGHRPRSVMVQQRWLSGIEELLADTDVPILLVPDEVAEQVTGYPVHRGALASMHRPESNSVADVVRDATLILILEDILDHTNVGAAFRAAAALGADAVLVSPRCGDPLYRRSVRVSMGTVFQVPWTRIGEWDEAGAELRAAGFTVAAMALTDYAVSLDDFSASRPEKIALVMGTEGAGLTAEALDAADAVVMIPMAGGVDSLNVASAAAVALWELSPARRRSTH